MNDDINADKDHNTRAKAWREILVIYGIAAAAILWTWLA